MRGIGGHIGGSPPRPPAHHHHHHHHRQEREKGKLKDLNKQQLRILFPFMRPQRTRIILAVIFTGLLALTGIYAPWISKLLIDDFILQGDYTGTVVMGATLVILYACNWGFSYGQSRTSTVAAQEVIRNFRVAIYEKILSLSLRFNNERRKGELLSLVTNDVNALSQAFTSGIIGFFGDLLSLGGVLIAMLLISPALTGISLIIVPLIAGTILLLRKKIRKAFIEVRRKVAMLSASVEENLMGIRVIKAMGVESRKDGDFSGLSQINFQTSMKATLLFAVMFAFISVNSFIAFALVIGFGGALYIQGAITLGGIFAFFQYVLMFIQPIRGMVSIYNQFQEASAALQHITEYMAHPVDVPEPASGDQVPLPDPVGGKIELRGVSFSYDREPLFEDLNLIIHPGEKVGLVGETGAGKTSLINLITRLYDVDAGVVLLDGVDIRHIPKKVFRPLFAVVSQNVVIFPDTIGNNIRFGYPEATDMEVERAAQMAQAHDFIARLKDGYETVLGERGAGLSGGQRQLIAYARMVLAEPRIAILDEATSNIDSYTENLIQQNMRHVLERCTTIVIAHRFATLQAVDRLILVQDGKIVAAGTHAELLAGNEYYRDLFEKQYSKL